MALESFMQWKKKKKKKKVLTHYMQKTLCGVECENF